MCRTGHQTGASLRLCGIEHTNLMTSARKEHLIDGLSPDELLALEELDELVITDTPINFKVGPSQVLAQFSEHDRVLRVEIAVVEDGGDGVVNSLIRVIERAARARDIIAIDWVVYATNCAVPNPKLTRVLERLGFQVGRLENGAECYRLRLSVNDRLRS